MVRGIMRLLITSCWLLVTGTVGAEESALEAYIAREDPSYAWRLVHSEPGRRATTHFLHLTSQTWRTRKEVDRSLWQHWLVVVEPEEVASSTGFLFISGGRNGRKRPDSANELVTQVALTTKSVVAELHTIPNQPLIFHGDGKPRFEDDLIAYAWVQYLETQDPTWLPRFPMVKSAVRAMDCLQAFYAQADRPRELDKFVVAGGSKRGWTTWLTGAIDPRVAAIIPMVIDVLNVYPSMRHHAEAYGFWATAVGNYYEHGLMQRNGDPQLDKLYRLVDPYYYRDQLTLPKFVLNASGDQFFLPDSSQFYWDELKGEKLLRYVPNADHSLKGSDALLSVIAYHSLIAHDQPRPTYDWIMAKDGTIRVTSKTPVKAARLWQASNPESRDFRVETIGKAYRATELEAQGENTFAAKVAPPQEGWTACFIELEYATPLGLPLKVTTGVRVTPETLPHAGVELPKVPYEAMLQNGKR